MNGNCDMANVKRRSSVSLHPMLLEDEEMLWELPEEWRGETVANDNNNNLAVTAVAAAPLYLQGADLEGGSVNKEDAEAKQAVNRRSSVPLHPMLLEDEEMLWEAPEEWETSIKDCNCFGNDSIGNNVNSVPAGCTTDNQKDAAAAVLLTAAAGVAAATLTAASTVAATAAAAAAPFIPTAAAAATTVAAAAGATAAAVAAAAATTVAAAAAAATAATAVAAAASGIPLSDAGATASVIPIAAAAAAAGVGASKRRSTTPWYLAGCERVGCWLTQEEGGEGEEGEGEGEGKGEGDGEGEGEGEGVGRGSEMMQSTSSGWWIQSSYFHFIRSVQYTSSLPPSLPPSLLPAYPPACLPAYPPALLLSARQRPPAPRCPRARLSAEPAP